VITQSAINILVVDDEADICDLIEETLSSERYNLIVMNDPSEAMDYIETHQIDLVLSDLKMGDFSGTEILEQTKRVHSDAVVILMTAHPTVRTAISVLKKGAYDFLVKPFKLELLKTTIERALEHQQVSRENVRLRGQVEFLKIVNANISGVEIDRILEMVVESCKNELDAIAVGLIEIDPKTGGSLNFFNATDAEEQIELVCDEVTLKKFLRSRRSLPIIEAQRIKSNNNQGVRIFIYQPILIRRTLHGIINIIIESRFGQVTPGQLDILSLLTNSAANAIANNNLYKDLQQSYLQAIHGLANAIEARDNHTAGHTDRVSILADKLADDMGWDDQQKHSLLMGCTLHDIGKIGVPDNILNKPAKLTDDEVKIMQEHPNVGLKIISDIDLFKAAKPFIIAHHERWDGYGYPNKLKGEEIPIEGRLLAVIDTFDAILSDRPYREGSTVKEAVSELIKFRGIQFDPTIVDTFIILLRQGKVDLKELYDVDDDLSCLDEIVISEKVSV
jgi:response regulator RpfG family c-di-GMP phosphodiesterase